MPISDEDVEKYIVRISAGKFIKKINAEFIVFKFPTNDIKLNADAIYNSAFQEALDNGLLDRQALEKLIIERKLFTEEDQEKLDKLNNQLDAQRILLSKTTVVRSNQDRIKNNMAKIRTEMFQLSNKKASRLAMSAEVKAEEERTLFMCWWCTYTIGNNRLWEKLSMFKKTTDIVLRDKILSEFLQFYSGIPTDVIRFIARSNLWRIRYVNSQKISDPLFGVPSSAYTTDMLNLAYWSNYYDNIYQMMPEDRPNDLTIEDDEALDAYMKAFYEERTREDASRRSKQTTPGKLSAFDKEEVIVMASNELYHDIEYDKPREARKLKDRIDLKKRTKRG